MGGFGELVGFGVDELFDVTLCGSISRRAQGCCAVNWSRRGFRFGMRSCLQIVSRRAGRGLACAVFLLVALLALVGCGGGSGHAGDPSASGAGGVAVGSVSEPNAVVVRVGGHAITKAAFAHAFAGAAKFEQLSDAVPVPPGFTVCIKHSQATTPSTVASKPTVAALKGDCEQEYQQLLKQALDPLISRVWVVSAAAEAGVSVSEAEFQRFLKKQEGKKSPTELASELAVQGQTIPEFEAETREILLGEGIRHQIAARTEHLSHAQVAAYYDAHKSQFATPTQRVVEIARTGTLAEALKVKREIASGRSFASVTRHLPVEQPIFSKNGVVPAYEPDLYQEAPLNRGILAAPLNVLSGPVKIFLGYYVFEVKHVRAAVQQPLSQAEASILQTLPNVRYKQGLADYVAALRKRWRARTSCQPGYTVAKCNGAPTEHEDPYTLG
jgi:hypothetical protein